MSNKANCTKSNGSSWKNDASRQRWQLFHQAIAHAKRSNLDAMSEDDESSAASKRSAPVLYVAK